MATDREKHGIVTLITKITYSKSGASLLKRVRVNIRDSEGVIQKLSDEEVDVGKKSEYKKILLAAVRDLEKERKDEFDDEINNLNEQITEIEAL